MTACRCIALALMATVFAAVPAFLHDDTAGARQFRDLEPISRPAALPRGARRPAQVTQVGEAVVRRAIAALAKAWNGQGLDALLDPQKFYDKQRLLDAIAENVPRSATLRVLSIGSISTLDQYLLRKPGGESRISIVTATVTTQVEFNDPTRGRVQLRGVNEFTLEISETVGGQ